MVSAMRRASAALALIAYGRLKPTTTVASNVSNAQIAVIPPRRGERRPLVRTDFEIHTGSSRNKGS